MMKNANNILTFPAARTAAGRTPPRPAPGGPEGAAAPESLNPQAPMLSLDEVRKAVVEDRVKVHYQPQYDLGTGQVRGAEALVRLLDADGQLVLPSRFIDRVEASDLIVALGKRVIGEVCRDLADLHQGGVDLPKVAINLGAHQLNTDHSLLETLDWTLNRFGLGYRDLEFELTERQALTYGDRGCATLHHLAEMGSDISLDDFGTGYSSVVALMELPINTIKLDRSIISDIPSQPKAQSIVHSLLGLARGLGCEVIAEGVEHHAQRAWLHNAGCDGAQGFGLARPMGLEQLHEHLETADSLPLAATAH